MINHEFFYICVRGKIPVLVSRRKKIESVDGNQKKFTRRIAKVMIFSYDRSGNPVSEWQRIWVLRQFVTIIFNIFLAVLIVVKIADPSFVLNDHGWIVLSSLFAFVNLTFTQLLLFNNSGSIFEIFPWLYNLLLGELCNAILFLTVCIFVYIEQSNRFIEYAFLFLLAQIGVYCNYVFSFIYIRQLSPQK